MPRNLKDYCPGGAQERPSKRAREIPRGGTRAQESPGEARSGPGEPHNEPKVAQSIPRHRNPAGPAEGWEGEEKSGKSVAN